MINVTIERAEQPEREQNINVYVERQPPTSGTRHEEKRAPNDEPGTRAIHQAPESGDRNQDIPLSIAPDMGTQTVRIREESEADPPVPGTVAEDQPEVKSEVPNEVPPEVKSELAPETPSAQSERKPEEKSTESVEKSSKPASKKVKVYNGLGRRHKASEIDEILDWYILKGELPDYVSDRQRYSYKHHVKLPERRQLLEQAGLIPGTSSRIKKRR